MKKDFNMTYLKTTSISMALAAVLGATSAFAGETPPTFAELDADANGQVSFSEFAIKAEASGEALTSAQRQFNVISGGTQSFTADQYENSFTVKGDIKAGATDSLVVMPSDSTAVKGAVESNDTLDESPQVTDEKALDSEVMKDDSMETETIEDDAMESETIVSDPIVSDPMEEPVVDKMDSEMNSATDTAIDPMPESETDVENNMSLENDTTIDTDTALETDTKLNTDSTLELDTDPMLENDVTSEIETTIDSPQVEDSELTIDPTEEAVQPENDTSYDTEFSMPDVPEKPVLNDAETEVGTQMDSEIEVEENQELNEPELDLDIKSDVETDLETNPDE